MNQHLARALLLAFLFLPATADAADFTQALNLGEPFGQNPFSVTDAFLRQEAFSSQVRYWQPSQPNVVGEVTYKLEVPFSIETAELKASITAYTVGADANFDPAAEVYLDVSIDNSTWTTIASQTNANACCSGIDGPWDITPIVAGAETVYVRSRLLSTVGYSGFGTAQFLRQGAPYGGHYFKATGKPNHIPFALLDFDSPVPSGVNDINGLGTGFTHWLPGTGGAIPRNDPNLDLLAMPGRLAFTSTRSDINQDNGLGRNLDNLDAPGFFLEGIEDRDFKIKAKFEGVSVPDLSDQLFLYAGVNEDLVVRGGMHESPGGGQFLFVGNQGVIDFAVPNTTVGTTTFTPGDDIELTLSRTDGVWELAWENLTNPAGGGSFGDASIPWLDSQTDLYVGLMHMDARNRTPQTAKVDYVEVWVEPIPEPCSAGIALTLIGAITLIRPRR